MTNMVSIIIPVYNRQDVIRECVQSVLMQSHQDFEILLIDDGSSDNTLAVCQELGNLDTRIRIFAMDHAGVSAARNRGLDEARGEFIFFLDSDDVIHPFLLATLVNALNADGAQMGGTDVARVREKNWDRVRDRLQQPSDPGETSCYSHEDTLRAVFFGKSPFGCIGGVMMRRSYIGDTKFRTDLFIGEDFYFIYENLIKGASSVFLKQKWYYVRLHEKNTSWNWGYDGFRTRFYRRQLVWEKEDAFGRTEYAACQKRDAVSCFLLCFAKNKANSDDSKKMRKVMKEYRRILFPALTCKIKVLYLLAVYMPNVYLLLLKLRRKGK